MIEVFQITVPYKLLVLFWAQAHRALEPGRLCFSFIVQCMGICCRLGPGLYLQSGFTCEGLILVVLTLLSCSLSSGFPMSLFIPDFLVTE